MRLMAASERRYSWPMRRAILALVFAGGSLLPVRASAHADTPRLLADVGERLRERPSDPDLLMQRGVLYLDEEYANYPQAIADLTAALRAPGHTEALIFRATAYLRTERHALALQDLDRYVATGRPDARAFEHRAEARRALGQRGAAVEDMARASRLAPTPDQYFRRAEWLEQDGRAVDAVTALHEGFERLGAPAELAVPLIEQAVRARKHDVALATIARMESQAGRPEPWRLRRAQVLAAAGRVPEARAAFIDLLASIQARERSGGYVNQTLLLEKAQALHGLGRDDEAQSLVRSLGPAARRLPEYQRLASDLGVSAP
jgi:tetratricopeptide (TPR) repeat protein